jgi:hypothetical protein
LECSSEAYEASPLNLATRADTCSSAPDTSPCGAAGWRGR